MSTFRFSVPAVAFALLLAFTWTAPARADILDFTGFLSGDQTYGDGIGVDVSHRVLDAFGNASITSPTLGQWATGYGDLVDVAYGPSVTPTDVGELRLDGLGGLHINLQSFKLASFAPEMTTNEEVRIYDGSFNLLASYPNQTYPEDSHVNYTPNVTASSVIIQWSYSYNVGIDDVVFSAVPAAVPEPSSLALATVALGSFLAVRKRRQGNPRSPQSFACGVAPTCAG